MTPTGELSLASTCVSALKVCPFCGSDGDLIHAPESVGVGVRCTNCGASIPQIHSSAAEATTAWNHRCNSPASLAALGGAATRGLSTRRKRVSSRRNLRKARERKHLRGIKAGIEESYAALQVARKGEQAEIEAAALDLAPNSRSWNG